MWGYKQNMPIIITGMLIRKEVFRFIEQEAPRRLDK
jgi:hypothetical protein